MTYRVTWKRVALRRLAAICLAAPNRRLVSKASDVAERQLMADPVSAGKPFKRGYRRYHVTPLTVEYTIDVGRGEVTIVNVLPGDRTT